jgi:hypothetical protein
MNAEASNLVRWWRFFSASASMRCDSAVHISSSLTPTVDSRPCRFIRDEISHRRCCGIASNVGLSLEEFLEYR